MIRKWGFKSYSPNRVILRVKIQRVYLDCFAAGMRSLGVFSNSEKRNFTILLHLFALELELVCLYQGEPFSNLDIS